MQHSTSIFFFLCGQHLTGLEEVRKRIYRIKCPKLGGKDEHLKIPHLDKS